MRTRRHIAIFTLTLAILAQGCLADYVARTGGVRQSYEQYEHGKAIEKLESRVEQGSIDGNARTHPDALLYLMDRGMILHAAGNYEESNAALHEAERLAARLDIVSVSEEASGLTTSARRRAYRGEVFELLLINVYKALNYAALGNREAALVEVRRAHERLRAMDEAERKDYHRLAVARYVAGVLWEWAGELDSAFIDYEKALQKTGNLEHLVEPLLRLARQTRRDDAYAELLERYPDIDHEPLGRNEGQVVIVISGGLSPVKKPSVRNGEQDLLALPYYQRRSWPRSRARVSTGAIELRAVTVTSVENVAVRHLEDRIVRMIGWGMAGVAIKGGVAAAIGAITKSEEVGLLAFNVLLASNRPDLRSWLSLPAEFQLARARLPAGEHVVEVLWGDETTRYSVTIRPGEVSVLPLRYY